MRLSPCVLVQPDGWARGEREGYGEPCDVTSLSLSLSLNATRRALPGSAAAIDDGVLPLDTKYTYVPNQSGSTG